MSLNILVVDDSSVVRAMIIKILKLTGLPLGNIHEAANGLEGLDALEANWIDLIFADINMPVMDGEEMIGHIRANPAWADLPLIIVSTEGSETRIRTLVEEKGARFIHKPFTPETIRRVVLDTLEIEHEQPIA